MFLVIAPISHPMIGYNILLPLEQIHTCLIAQMPLILKQAMVSLQGMTKKGLGLVSVGSTEFCQSYEALI